MRRLGFVAVVVIMLSLVVPPRAGRLALAAIPSVYLPNVTKTLGGTGGWTTPVAIQNTGQASTTVALDLYRFSDGSSVATLQSPSLRPGQAWLFDPLHYAELPNDTQFALVLRPASATVAAVVLEGMDRAAMAYSGTTTGASTLYLPNVTRRLGGPGGWDTPFIVQNLGGAATTVSVLFYGFADGALARRLDGITIQPGRSQAVVPLTIDGLRDDSQYSVVVQGPPGAQLHAIVNEHQGDQAMSYAAQQAGAQNLYLPNVMKYVGAEAWHSPFIVQNVGASTTSFWLAFYPVGTAQLVASTSPITLAPGRSYPVDVRFFPVGLPAGRYSVAALGDRGAQLVAIVNQHTTGKAMSYEGFASADRVAALPYVTKNSGFLRWSSQIVAQNLGATSDLAVTLFDAQGNVATRKTYPAIQNGISVLYDLAADAALQDGVYSALVQADQRVAAVANIVGVGSGDFAMSYTSTAVSTDVTQQPVMAPAPTPAPVVAPTPMPPAAPTPVPTVAPAPVGVQPNARRYSMANVLVVPAGTDQATVSKLAALTDGIAAIFPDHWAAATSGLSAMTVTPTTAVIVDTTGSLLAQTRVDTATALTIFYQSHQDAYDFVNFFQFKDVGYYNHHTHQQSEPATYRQAPSYMPAGVTRLKGHNVISISPRYYAQDMPKNYVPVLLHETHHQWCCYVTTPAGYGLASNALTPPEAGYVHWSSWLFVPPSPKYPIIGGDASGWGWRDNHDGTYTLDCGSPDPSVPGNFTYPKLGLFVMGLVTADQVPPVEILAGTGDPRPVAYGSTCGTYRVPKVTIPISAFVAANPYLQR